ncbi:MAG: circadian clock protein KaiB [Chitinophagaceae bacterium]|nr:MAG: circadian clock protein KaiB [Chitinophagaceae bacterium]
MRKTPRNHASHEKEFVLRLFVTGASPNSLKALNNIREICENHAKGNYSLEVIDVYQNAELVQQEQIIALPLLVRKNPLPERKLIGDLSEKEKVIKYLGLEVK